LKRIYKPQQPQNGKAVGHVNTREGSTIVFEWLQTDDEDIDWT